MININQAETFCEENKIKPGDDIIVTKWIALAATARLAKEGQEALGKRFPQWLIKDAIRFAEYLPVEEDLATAEKSGTGAVFELGDGGIFAALWNYADASGVGLEIDIKKIPIRQETVEICEFFGENPYELDSGGSLLIATDDGTGMVSAFEKAGIHAVIIGKATSGNDRVLLNGDHRRFLDKTRP